MSIRITHIRLWEGPPTHQRITHLNWVDLSDGTTNSSTKAQIVEWIEAGGTAYVDTGSAQVRVRVVHPTGATSYLRTYADQTWTNNLLELPAF